MEKRGSTDSSNREKWNNQKWNCQVGDMVLLRQKANRNQWPVAQIVNIYSDSKGNVHSVRLLLLMNLLVLLIYQITWWNDHWKCVFQEICGCKWICEFNSHSKIQCCASRCCCNILRGANCKGTWANRQQAIESYAA